jgi:hypothetical protein
MLPAVGVVWYGMVWYGMVAAFNVQLDDVKEMQRKRKC